MEEDKEVRMVVDGDDVALCGVFDYLLVGWLICWLLRRLIWCC